MVTVSATTVKLCPSGGAYSALSYRRPTVSAASGSARHAWGRDGAVVLEGAAGVGDRWSGGARVVVAAIDAER